MTDPTPEEIDPVIIELFRTNPAIKEYMILFLAGQATYQECLEHSIVKLCEQYTGAIAGWKDQAQKTKVEYKAPDGTVMKLTGRMVEIPMDQDGISDSLVNETPMEYQSPESERLHLALGILGKIVSPGRAAAFIEGTSDAFPPIQLSREILNQIKDLFTKQDISDYVKKVDPCSRCGFTALLVVDGKNVCAVCDARRGRSEFRLRSDNLIKSARTIEHWCKTHHVKVPDLLLQSIQEPVEYERQQSDARL